ncbi:MAG TPA: helix-turn-helix domain-containing protein [Ktedonobacteraceae bacterium]|nr:helix-turn-helix domain-containing protein [Ktedonobacteraceae bacterium]
MSLAWSAAELARRARLTPKTVARVEHGEPVYAHTVAAIARALSEALGKTITIRDFDGVNLID